MYIYIKKKEHVLQTVSFDKKKREHMSQRVEAKYAVTLDHMSRVRRESTNQKKKEYISQRVHREKKSRFYREERISQRALSSDT